MTKNFTLNSVLPPHAPSLQAANLAAASQNTNLASATIIAVHNQGALTLEDQASIDHLETQVRSLPHVIAVHDLSLVLRSLIAPLYLVVSVALSYLAALGVVGLVFVRLVGQAGIYFILPFALFVFLMALGSDYNILVMTRIREEAHSQPLREAVRQAIARTGSTVTTAGVILAGTFAVLAVTATDDQSRQFGFGVAGGILMDTFLIRTLLIPAVVVLLGRWNWWPAPLFHRASTTQIPPGA